MRHATVGQVGDPLALKLDDCSVQRNLSQKGKSEAEHTGRAFRDRSVPVAEVLSSRYCRTRDTARLTFGRATTWQPLDLLVAVDEQERDARTETVAKRIADHVGESNLVLVTHSPNIDALTFEMVETGGFLVLKPDGDGSFDIVGRYTP